MPDPALVDYLRSFVTQNKQEKFARISRERTRHLTVVLENVYQAHNASAVLRSCDAFGIQDVHIAENEVEFSVKKDVALGSSKWLTIHRYAAGETATADSITALKSNGYTVVATTPHASDDETLEHLDIARPTALLIGGELRGLSDEALELADCRMKIPMHGFTESFNLSVSAAIMLHHLTSKLRDSDIDWRLPETDRQALIRHWVKQTLGQRYEKLKERFEEERGAE